MASKAPKPRKLTARQERFVGEYLKDLNATQAAIRAGYAPKDADVQGPRLLGIIGIAKAVADAKAARLERVHFTQDRVLEELSLLAFSDISQYTMDDEGNLAPAEGASAGVIRAVSSVKRKVRVDAEGNVEREAEFRLWDKPGMLKLAGRHVGLFPDRVEVVGPNGGPVQIETAPKTSADLRRELAELTGDAAEDK